MNNKEGKKPDPSGLRADGTKFRYTVVLRGIKFLNAVLITLPFAAAWYLHYNQQILGGPFYEKGNWLVVFLFFILYAYFGKTYDAFLVSYNRVSEMIYSQMLAAVFADFIIFIATWLLEHFFPKVWPMLLVLAAQFVFSALWCWISNRWYFRTFRPKRTIVVQDMRKNLGTLVKKYRLEKKYDIIGSVLASDCVSRLEILDYAEVVFLSGVHSHDRNIIIKYCVENDITALIIPRIGDVLMSGAHRVHLFHLPILRLDRFDPPIWYAVLKRFFDIVLSFFFVVNLKSI